VFRQASRETIGDDVLERATQRGRWERANTRCINAAQVQARVGTAARGLASRALASGVGRP